MELSIHHTQHLINALQAHEAAGENDSEVPLQAVDSAHIRQMLCRHTKPLVKVTLKCPCKQQASGQEEPVFIPLTHTRQMLCRHAKPLVKVTVKFPCNRQTIHREVFISGLHM